MGQTLSMAAMYCCCSAGSNLCNACFGTTAAGTTGRKRSVLLLALVIASALWFQYSIGPSIVSQSGWIWKLYRSIPFLSGRYIYEAWHDPCAEIYGENNLDLIERCAGNAGVFRPTCLSALYFLINSIVTAQVPALNRVSWPAKYALFAFALLASLFVPSHPFFDGIFLWLARFGAAIFVVLQQIILIDVAYNWNDDWVGRANESDRLSFGSGTGWLHAIVGVCVALYTACLVFIGLMYAHYTGGEENGCAGNTWVVTMTLLGIVGVTLLQLMGTGDGEGSLLTSGVISLYAVYLCYSIVSTNPSGSCNPQLGSNDVWGITIGLLLTTVSLIWTGWSYTADTRLSVEAVQSAKAVTPARSENQSEQQQLDLDVPLMEGQESIATGTVTTGTPESAVESSSLRHVWKLNVVMALISCYVAMILTGWGTVNKMDEENHNAANPTIGHVNMAIIGVSQWLALGLYGWTLLAPRIFPDRDFSY